VGEGPRLAAEVARVRDLDAGLLPHLAGEGLFERLAGLDEAGEGAEEGRGELRRVSEERLVAAADEDDDGWGDPGIDGERAGGAAPAVLAGQALGRRAAGAAEAVRALEVEQLRGAARELPQLLGQPPEEPAQTAGFEVRRERGVRRASGAAPAAASGASRCGSAAPGTSARSDASPPASSFSSPS
jgi:hypothetical protein